MLAHLLALIRAVVELCAWLVALLAILITLGCGGGVRGSNTPPPATHRHAAARPQHHLRLLRLGPGHG